MPEIKIFDSLNKPNSLEKKEIVDFLYEHLDQYGDPKDHILRAIEYSIKDIASFGGFTMLLKENDKLQGAVVINSTGMGGYIPENILVYIAVHRSHRGEGLGKKLMEQAISLAQGDIALHVEADNPAKRLYEKFGFTNPYLEMRMKNNS